MWGETLEVNVRVTYGRLTEPDMETCLGYPRGVRTFTSRESVSE